MSEPNAFFRICRVVNESPDRTFKGKFANRVFTIPPLSETLVPYEAVTLWMGDPNARNIDNRRRDRVDEFTRLRTKYGAYENDSVWEVNKPCIKAFDAATGEQVITVMDDPDGTMGMAGSDPGSGADLQTQIGMLQSQLALMTEMMQRQAQVGVATPITAEPIGDANGEDDEGGVIVGRVAGSGLDSSNDTTPFPVFPPVLDGAVPAGMGHSGPDAPAAVTGPVGGNVEAVAGFQSQPDPAPSPMSPAATADTPSRPKTGPRRVSSGSGAGSSGSSGK